MLVKANFRLSYAFYSVKNKSLYKNKSFFIIFHDIYIKKMKSEIFFISDFITFVCWCIKNFISIYLFFLCYTCFLLIYKKYLFCTPTYRYLLQIYRKYFIFHTFYLYDITKVSIVFLYKISCITRTIFF